MLLVTGTGTYLTIVEDMDDAEMVFVRSQDKLSVQRVISKLERVVPIPDTRVTYELIENPEWDYQFRVHLTKALFSTWLEHEAMKIDYHKVKPTVSEARGFDHPISKMVEDVFYDMSHNRPDGSLPGWLRPAGRRRTQKVKRV